MKVVCTADWHLTDKNPRNRIGNYLGDMLAKIQYIYGYTRAFIPEEEQEETIILHGGDFFDSYKANDSLKSTIIQFLREREIPLYTVFGQHDLRFHSSNRENTPLYVLYSAEVLQIIREELACFFFDGKKNINIYGSSWSEEIPSPEKGKLNILVTHRMVANDPLWPGQSDFERPSALLRRYNYDLIVTGDNHNTFSYEYDGRYLVNPGSLMRMSIDQVDHKPTFFVYDTVDRSLETVEIPCKPSSEVLRLKEAEEEKELNTNLLDFIENLKGNVEVGTKFETAIMECLGRGGVEPKVKKIVEEIINDL